MVWENHLLQLQELPATQSGRVVEYHASFWLFPFPLGWVQPSHGGVRESKVLGTLPGNLAAASLCGCNSASWHLPRPSTAPSLQGERSSSLAQNLRATEAGQAEAWSPSSLATLHLFLFFPLTSLPPFEQLRTCCGMHDFFQLSHETIFRTLSKCQLSMLSVFPNYLPKARGELHVPA